MLFSFKCFDTGVPFPHFILISYLKFVGIFHQSRLILSQGCAPSEELTKIIRLEWLQIFAMWKHYVSHVFKYHLFYIMWFPNSHLQLWSFPWLSDLHVQWPNWHLFLDVSKAFRDQLNVPIGKRLTVPNPVPLLHSSSFLFKWTSHSKQNLPVPFGNKWSLHIPTQFAPVKTPKVTLCPHSSQPELLEILTIKHISTPLIFPQVYFRLSHHHLFTGQQPSHWSFSPSRSSTMHSSQSHLLKVYI